MTTVDERVRYYEPFFGKWYLNDPPEVLGQGNSGTVYLVHSDQDVSAALKVIPIPRDEAQYKEKLQAFGGSEERVREWIDRELRYAQTEIEIMQRMKKENNIVCFEDATIYQRADTYGYDVIIRMEKLVRLDSFLRVCDFTYNMKRNEELFLRIWIELAQGLRFCEAQGIVHFDVKPDNIFYAEPTRNLFKLGDFGVSIRSENGRKVGEGMIVGTRNYMAPEIYGAYGGDIRSDMYSLALVMYELFNDGKLPYIHSPYPSDEENEAALSQRFSGATLPPPRNISVPLWEIMARCLAYYPENRYPSMDALLSDLTAYKKQIERRRIRRGIFRPAIFGMLGALLLVFILAAAKPSASRPQNSVVVVNPALPDAGESLPDNRQRQGGLAQIGGVMAQLPGPAQGSMSMPVEDESGLPLPTSEPSAVSVPAPETRSLVGPALGYTGLAALLVALLIACFRVMAESVRREIGDEKQKREGDEDATPKAPMPKAVRPLLTAAITVLTAGLGLAVYRFIALFIA
ncbi:MAG: serine/threonine protein kinase [Clostridia bacterium]|nr:serine/threonine protein kinase [Clostridia bacterium]